MNKISIKGILLGTITDTIGSMVIGMILGPIFAVSRFTEGMSEQEMSDAILAMTQDNDFLLTSLFFGILFTILGGYIAARVANKEIYLNSGMVGVIGILLGIFFAGESALWFDIAGFISVIPAALLGGYLYKSKAYIENA